MNQNKISIYCDGAYSSSRNQGGWAFIVIIDNIVIHKQYSGLINTTNVRMEMIAALESMKYINQYFSDKDIEIYSDSLLVINTLKNEWQKKANLDLWLLLENELKGNMKFIHVKGHNGDKFNELVDMWAVFGSNLINCKNDKN